MQAQEDCLRYWCEKIHHKLFSVTIFLTGMRPLNTCFSGPCWNLKCWWFGPLVRCDRSCPFLKLSLIPLGRSPPCNVVPKCFFNTATVATVEARNSATKHSKASDRLLDVSWRLSGSFCKIQPNNATPTPSATLRPDQKTSLFPLRIPPHRLGALQRFPQPVICSRP